MYCGNCIRDNALVRGLRELGHEVLMVPLYLPLTLDEPDQSAGTPVFFGGINVYLEHHWHAYDHAPHWLHDWLSSPALLRWAGKRSSAVAPRHLGGMTLSMLRGESGRQARELRELIAWLKSQPRPDVVCLSNVLLIGMAREIGRELSTPVICQFQGEDNFLDALPEPYRTQCWSEATARARDVRLFISPSQYFAGQMQGRLKLAPERIRVAPNGISLDGYPEANVTRTGQVIGFFARMNRDKGLDLLVEAFLQLRQEPATREAKLVVGGFCGPAEASFVARLRERIHEAGAAEAVTFHPNVDRAEKLRLLGQMRVFSVPARMSEAFGLYVVEALAAGLPVVLPDRGAFSEIVSRTGGGILYGAEDVEGLKLSLGALLQNPEHASHLGSMGRAKVREGYGAIAMAKSVESIYATVLGKA
jgi:glycosyltransferase involved in cell wall biosynthesis